MMERVDVRVQSGGTGKGALLMGDEDFESIDDLCQWDGTVLLPVLDGFHVVDHDHKVLIFALVVDFGSRTVSASHLVGVGLLVLVEIGLSVVLEFVEKCAGCMEWSGVVGGVWYWLFTMGLEKLVSS